MVISVKDNHAPMFQFKYNCFYCDMEDGIHLVFKSRYKAESFASEFFTEGEYQIKKVFAENGKELGFEVFQIISVTVKFIQDDDYYTEN